MLPENVPPSHYRAAIARAERRRKQHPEDLDAVAQVEALRTEYRTVALADHIRRVVDDLPALTNEQKSKLALMLQPTS